MILKVKNKNPNFLQHNFIVNLHTFFSILEVTLILSAEIVAFLLGYFASNGIFHTPAVDEASCVVKKFSIWLHITHAVPICFYGQPFRSCVIAIRSQSAERAAYIYLCRKILKGFGTTSARITFNKLLN